MNEGETVARCNNGPKETVLSNGFDENIPANDGIDTKPVKPKDVKGNDALSKQISYGVGTIEESVDDVALRLQGHEAILERSFNVWAALGLAFSVTGSWVGYSSCFGQNLVYGGGQSVVFGLLIATFVQGSITLGLSEISSAFPTTGGQYHYVFLLGSNNTKRVAAFFTGWVCVIGWWTITASGHLLAAVSITGLASFWRPEYQPERWHTYLLYLAIAGVTAAPVFFIPRHISKLTELCLYLSLSGCLILFVMALAMHQHFYPTSQALASGLGTSEWPRGVAWILGIGNAMYAYVGTDAATHVSEEMSQPQKRVPRIMNGSIIMGFLSVFPLMLVLMYSMSDMAAVMNSKLPSLELYYQVTGSKVAATFMQSWLTLIYVNSLNAQWVTSGRIAWAFARDGGLPFSTYFAQIDKKRKYPLRATVLAGCFICLYGLIYLASSNAFNSIVTSAVLYLNISYATPQAILLWRGRNRLPKASFRLGSIIGTFCNAFSPIAVIFMTIIFSFPAKADPTVGSMNYSAVVLVGLLVIVLGLWFTVGEHFKGPHADLERTGVLNRAGEGGLVV